jgi:allophanate hydrolase
MTTTESISAIYDRIESEPLNPVWISLVSREVSLARAADAQGPLAGLTFAIKDNIDLAGLPTTAACPAYAYSPAVTAPVVQRLLDAGAIPIGKTNMDQFATGLVGTRSPHGACSSVFDSRYISGGSSSGSAVAVAKGLVDFSLGTDTAGSGRVPAAFNGLIGLKPTRGLLSTRGIVPACRSLDCVSIFARDVATTRAVFDVAKKKPRESNAPSSFPAKFRFGVPAANQLEFFGDHEAAELYSKAISIAESIGGQKVEIDFSPFRATADLLYSGPWVAERLAAIGAFMANHADEMNPVVRQIIAGGAKYTAVDTFEAQYRLQDLCDAAATEWARMDTMLLPTTGTIFTHEAVAADPIGTNTKLGYYTNFVNLMDLAAVAIPAGSRPNGLPFGVSFVGRGRTDDALLSLADAFLRGKAASSNVGLRGTAGPDPDHVAVAVVGAHLTGQPLNWQLTQRGAHLIKTCRTAHGYRLYALDATTPPKPGLVRDDAFEGPGIEVEVWAMAAEHFGSFVAAIPPPLGIGSATLDDGHVVKCFICEPYAIPAATEITHFGGWRKYLASRP